MLQLRKRYLLGALVCGAAYLGIRWVYLRWTREEGVEEEQEEEGDDIARRKNISVINSRKQPFRRNRSANSVKFGQNNYVRSISLNSLPDGAASGAASVTSSWTNRTSNQIFYDVEPNLHFFKIYQDQLAVVDNIPMPRTDRTHQMFCESQDEFLAKVSCLRCAFQDILYEPENCVFFVESGREILRILLEDGSEDTMNNCLNAYQNLLDYVGDEENHDDITNEIAQRRIPMLSFYDLAVDYIILESLDDLDKPPPIISSIVSNSWVSASFRQSGCQSAVSTALKYKRNQLKCPNGFFAHFYSVLDHLSPTLAWGFLGSDEDLKFKCEFLKESLLSLCRDYFSFDRVRYTSYQDLRNDIMEITRDRYSELTERLTL